VNSGDVATIFVTTVVTGAVTVLLLARMKYRARGSAGSAELREIAERLEHLERAVDAVAVETERIAEGQRFTTKLLGERDPQAARRP